jgi:hypothetical protein
LLSNRGSRRTFDFGRKKRGSSRPVLWCIVVADRASSEEGGELMQLRRSTSSSAAVLSFLVLTFAARPPAAVMAAGPAMTAKERLSDKASDNQRVDNCGVPAERRGPVPRPGCPGEAAGSEPATGQAPTKGTASAQRGR